MQLFCIILIVSILFFKAGRSVKPFQKREAEISEEEINKKVMLYEEDMYVNVLIYQGMQFRSAIDNRYKLWEGAVVPYEISDEYKDKETKLILDAMEDFHNRTCIRFKPKKDEDDYILIQPGNGCKAVLGMSENITRVTLHENCFLKGIIIHELMHVLGFMHEQNRPDRDDFVKIDFDNIEEGAETNFKKYSDDESWTLNQTYDYGSVMHYGAFDFAKDKDKPVIIPLQKNVEIGQREGFSEKDVATINLLYNCTESEESSATATVTTEEELPVTTTVSPDLAPTQKKSRLGLFLCKLFKRS